MPHFYSFGLKKNAFNTLLKLRDVLETFLGLFLRSPAFSIITRLGHSQILNRCLMKHVSVTRELKKNEG